MILLKQFLVMPTTSNILFVAPYSYPVINPEAIVNIKVLELLTQNSYKIDLISKRIKWTNYPLEKSLGDLNVTVGKNLLVEVGNKVDLKSIYGHLSALFKFGTVFKGAHWAYQVITKNREFIESGSYDIVMTKNAPSFLVGDYLKKKGLKWIATWNDPYPEIMYPEPYGTGPDTNLPLWSRKVLEIMSRADVHIFPNDRLRNYMLQYLSVDLSKTRIIPHLAFPPNRTQKNITGKSHLLKLVHSGNVKNPRDPKPLVRALSRLIKEHKFRDIRLDFIGVYDLDLKTLIKELKMEDYVKLLPPSDYVESLEIMANYDVALIIEAACDEGIFLPTKVGDYMTCQIPIFTISPVKGVLADLYAEGSVQYRAESGNEASIYDELVRLYSDYRAGTIRPSVFKKEYSGDSILAKYNAIISELKG